MTSFAEQQFSSRSTALLIRPRISNFWSTNVTVSSYFSSSFVCSPARLASSLVPSSLTMHCQATNRLVANANVSALFSKFGVEQEDRMHNVPLFLVPSEIQGRQEAGPLGELRATTCVSPALPVTQTGTSLPFATTGSQTVSRSATNGEAAFRTGTASG